MYRELFRYFQAPEQHNMAKNRNIVPLVSVIGMCAAVPMEEVMAWIQVYKNHGAAFTWWHTPEDRAVRAVKLASRRRTDHEQVFRLLDAGLTRTAICEQLDLPMPNLDYIARKWQRQNV
jgi:hypothetical protein